jgi:hypothetical protein
VEPSQQPHNQRPRMARSGKVWRLTGRYQGEEAGDKQLQSDGNMRGLQEKESSRFRRGAMSIDFSQAAASQMAAIIAARFNGERVEADSVHPMPPALLNVRAQSRHDQAAGHA